MTSLRSDIYKVKIKNVVQLKFLVLLALFSSVSAAKETIDWMTVDWPPVMILDGEDKGKGRFDILLQLYQDNLPQYNHQSSLNNFTRYWHSAKNGQPTCNILALKNSERQEYMHYSIPSAITLPNSIIMKQDSFVKLGSPSSYSLVDLILDKRFLGILESGRSYSTQIDVLLKKHQEASNLIQGVNSAKQLLQMLELGRVDYIIEYPYISGYLRSKHMSQTPKFSSIAIKEIPLYYFVHTACPKTDWGKKVIDAVNKILLKIRPTAEYRAANELWYFSDREIQLIRQVYDTEFLKAQ
jgi:uncharacterized protein (TIGR02285 family)